VCVLHAPLCLPVRLCPALRHAHCKVSCVRTSGLCLCVSWVSEDVCAEAHTHVLRLTSSKRSVSFRLEQDDAKAFP
jgi:hypothetical protein